MSRQQKLEQQKIKESARMADGFSRGVSLSQGLVVGADGMSAGADIGAHSVVIPWMGNPHIKIVVSAD